MSVRQKTLNGGGQGGPDSSGPQRPGAKYLWCPCPRAGYCRSVLLLPRGLMTSTCAGLSSGTNSLALQGPARQQVTQGLGAVAELVLQLRLQLRRAAALLWHPEQRVVAEALVAARRLQNTPFPAALADQGHGVLREA